MAGVGWGSRLNSERDRECTGAPRLGLYQGSTTEPEEDPSENIGSLVMKRSECLRLRKSQTTSNITAGSQDKEDKS